MVSKRMKSTPAMACLKTLMTIFSIIFLTIGVAFLAAGIWSKVQFSSLDKLSTIDYSTAPWVMIAIGCFIVIVGLMGCCATIKGNTCLLRTYGLLLALIFVCELAGAIFAVIFRSKVDGGFKVGMDTAIKAYTTNGEYKKAFDNAQIMLHCCGVQNYTDWWLNGKLPTNNVPQSCCMKKDLCKPNVKGSYIDLTTVANPSIMIYTKGCHAIIYESVNGNLAIIIGTMFGVAFFQLIGLILACCLASTINSNKYELV